MKTQEEVEIILSVLNDYAERFEAKEGHIDRMLQAMGGYEDLECDTDRLAYEVLEEEERLAQLNTSYIEAAIDAIREIEGME